MRKHRAPGKPAGPSGNGKGSGEGLGRGKPMGARARTRRNAEPQQCGAGLNSGTERILEVGESGGFGHRGPTTRRKDSWRQENHCLGEELRRVGRLGGGSGAGESRRSARNQANPMTGSRAQQTCKPCAEKNTEVGKNDKGGTCSGVANPNLGKPSVDAHGEVGGGAVFEELQERSPRERVTSVTRRRGQQANQCVFGREATGTRCVWDGGSCLRDESWSRTTWAWERPTTHSSKRPAK